MRLLVFFPGVIRGGCEEHAFVIIRAAVRGGDEVVACFPQTPGTRSLTDDIREAGASVLPWPLGEIVDGRMNLGSAQRQEGLAGPVLDTVNPDAILLFLPEPDSSMGFLTACADRGLPTVPVFCLVPPEWPVSEEDRRRGARARRARQRWVAISQDNRRHLATAFRIGAADEVDCVLNGVDLPRDWQEPDSGTVAAVRRAVREELVMPPTARIALTVARLAAPKGHADLLAAISELPAAADDVRFVWAGEGGEDERLLSLIERAGLDGRVHLLGHRQDVARLLHAADLFVFPTHWEGCSRALIEAMSAGLPIVASDASSNPELLDGGRLGLLFPARDRTALAERMSQALSEPDEMAAMAAKARSKARRELTEAAMCEGTLAVVDKIVRR
ncbi:glycosyltransferase [Nonomuraea sp. NPDC049655]|uniref:glycosyltransferase n=1 Tax=Nonomuraea sp. NPDC049655 TaxID=3364355 RepID=UPI00378ACD76